MLCIRNGHPVPDWIAEPVLKELAVAFNEREDDCGWQGQARPRCVKSKAPEQPSGSRAMEWRRDTGWPIGRNYRIGVILRHATAVLNWPRSY